MEALTYDPSTKGTKYIFMIGDMSSGPGYLNPNDDPNFPTTNLLFVFNADGSPVRGFNEYNDPATGGPRSL